ncbi:MAG: hypothetical protein LBL36_06690, partial [Clostridiales Family XIII bacterium]|nr:hypothetical protein [Clostridiales Family XIII bacterium]
MANSGRRPYSEFKEDSRRAEGLPSDKYMSAQPRPESASDRPFDDIYEENRAPHRPLREQEANAPLAKAGEEQRGRSPAPEPPVDRYAESYFTGRSEKKPRGGVLKKLLGTRDEHDEDVNNVEMSAADEEGREARRQYRDGRAETPSDRYAESYYTGDDEKTPRGGMLKKLLGTRDEHDEDVNNVEMSAADEEGR